MADIRIKDLTTTASSTASDDFIAVDGTTNGTRKLNAFSPTFGGNATVTGTLTVNGTGTNSIPNLSVTGIGGLNVSANFLTSANTLRFSDSAAGGQTWFMSPQLGDGVATNFAFYSNDGVTSTPLFRVSSAGVFRLPSTAASTTTSTGALVVGNGTSGGLGVGGSINTGGTLRFHTNANLPGVGSMGISATYGLNMYASTGSSYDFTVFNAAGSSLILNPTGTQNLTLPGVITLSSSTASTSTSSGALVVSGGVGVAKNASIGVNNSTGVLRVCDNSFGSDYVVLTTAGTDGTGTYGLFISQTSGTGLNAPTGQVASLRVNNAAIVSANSAGPILQLTGTAPTLTGNSSLTFEFTSNTSLTLKMRGSDGVTRSASITFA